MLIAVTKRLSQTPSMAISNATKNSTIWLLEPSAEHSSHMLFGRVKMIGILPPLIVLSSMTLIGTKLNLHLLYPIQCMMSMGSSVDMFLFTNASDKFTTSMHSTPSRVLITTNFVTPWSNLQTTPIATSTLSSTVLIVYVTFTTMRQWRPLLSLS
jgi:hypothetical protein